MKSKGGQGQNRLMRIIALPWKALVKARDCYVGTMTSYAVVNPRSLPKSYSVSSATTTRSSNVDSEDFRELVRAASARSMGENFELNLLIQQQIRQQLEQQMPSRKVPRSVSVGMGRIDEDKPFVLGGDQADVSRMLMNKDDFKYPRSRSHAVSKTNSFLN